MSTEKSPGVLVSNFPPTPTNKFTPVRSTRSRSRSTAAPPLGSTAFPVLLVTLISPAAKTYSSRLNLTSPDTDRFTSADKPLRGCFISVISVDQSMLTASTGFAAPSFPDAVLDSTMRLLTSNARISGSPTRVEVAALAAIPVQRRVSATPASFRLAIAIEKLVSVTRKPVALLSIATTR